MIVNTQGIVLQTVKYSDNSLIVKIFTRKCGTISFIIKHAFSKKTKQPATLFAPLTILNLIFNETSGEKLIFLKEVSIVHPFHSIFIDIKKSTLSLFYQELLSKLLYSANAPEENLFDYIKEHLLMLDATLEVAPDVHIVFLIQLIQYLGYMPELNFSIDTPYFSIESSNFGSCFIETSHFLSKEASFYLYNILKNHHYITPNKKTRMELLNGMILYLMKYNKQIKEIKSVEILSEIFRV